MAHVGQRKQTLDILVGSCTAQHKCRHLSRLSYLVTIYLHKLFQIAETKPSQSDFSPNPPPPGPNSPTITIHQVPQPSVTFTSGYRTRPWPHPLSTMHPPNSPKPETTSLMFHAYVKQAAVKKSKFGASCFTVKKWRAVAEITSIGRRCGLDVRIISGLGVCTSNVPCLSEPLPYISAFDKPVWGRSY